MTVRVLLVDDHPVVRMGMQALLEGQEGLEVVGAVASGEEALRLVGDGEVVVDVVLCDLRMGEGIDGVTTTRALLQTDSRPAVVILTTYDHDVDIVRAVEAGASGYLLKDAGPVDIVGAVRAAARGETVLSDAMTLRVTETMRRRRVTLSPRELAVLRLAAEGLSNRVIARRLEIGEATVKSHLNHVFTKLEADSRTAAVAAARASGLID